jgi:photosystem II stability/assembly factor-like uncharacterized protein
MTPAQDYIYGLAAAPDFATSGVCYAAHLGGLHRSGDGGRTWYPALASLGLGMPVPATSVAVAGDGAVFVGLPGGIVSSRDSGATWSRALLPSPAPSISALAISPHFSQDGTVFAGTIEDGVFVSINRGINWQAWNIGLLDHSILCLAVSPGFGRDALVFAGTEGGIFYSANGGRYWRELGFPMEHAPVLCLALSSDYEQTGQIFAGTAANGLFSSSDRGQHWGTHSLPEGAINALLVTPDQHGILALVDDLLLFSGDNGATWTPWNSGDSSGGGVASVAAPLSLGVGQPLLVGYVDGRIKHHTLNLNTNSD